MKKITLLLTILTLIVASCNKKTTKEFSEKLQTNLTISNEQEAQEFLKTLKNFYNEFFNEKQENIEQYLNDEIISTNKIGENYSIQILKPQDIKHLVYYPGEKMDTFFDEEFPNYDPVEEKWEKEGIFVRRYNKNELLEILELSPSTNVNKAKFDSLNDKITFKVLDTYHNTITYWGKVNGKWKTISIEILD